MFSEAALWFYEIGKADVTGDSSNNYVEKP